MKVTWSGSVSTWTHYGFCMSHTGQMDNTTTLYSQKANTYQTLSSATRNLLYLLMFTHFVNWPLDNLATALLHSWWYHFFLLMLFLNSLQIKLVASKLSIYFWVLFWSFYFIAVLELFYVLSTVARKSQHFGFHWGYGKIMSLAAGDVAQKLYLKKWI